MRRKVVLLGDSVFDNAAYVGAGQSVVEHLRSLLQIDDEVCLLAIDGTTTGDFAPQLEKVPGDATHLVLSLGGNDAIMSADLLGTPVSSTAEALELFGQRARFFEASYAKALDSLLDQGVPTCVCTIYNGNLSAAEASIARTALSFFNDALVRVAIERRARVLDLRRICSTAEDYANPIEPSAQGGRKIAHSIARWLSEPIEGSPVGCLISG